MHPQRARLFQNGGSQAVRLPRHARFLGVTDVLVRREGRRVILEPADEWPPEFAACLGAWTKAIPRPAQRAIADERNPLA